MIAGGSSKSHKPKGQQVLVLICSTYLLATISVAIYGQNQNKQEFAKVHAELEHVRALLQQQQAVAAFQVGSSGQQQSIRAVDRPRNLEHYKQKTQLEFDSVYSGEAVHAKSTLSRHAHVPTLTNDSMARDRGSYMAMQQNQQQQSQSTAPGTICLDMVEMLKLRAYMGGITWEPKNCYTGLAEMYPSIAEQQTIRSKLISDLQLAAADARGLQAKDINTTEFWWASAIGQAPVPSRAILADPAFEKWQVSLMHVLSRYLVTFVEHFPAVPCPGMPNNMSIGADELPLPGCPGRTDKELIHTMGRFAQPYDAIEVIADVVLAPGLCTVSATDGAANYGDFLMSRVMSPQWQTFKASSLEEDAVLFLTDILYQLNGVYLEQRWLGVNAMQNPFDFMSIADIIHQVRPDVIIETGTANGGSALMWASMLELSGLHNSSIITMDFTPPGTEHAFGADDASNTAAPDENPEFQFPFTRKQLNPTHNPLWQKYVTFVQGDTLDPQVHSQVLQLLQAQHVQLSAEVGEVVIAQEADVQDSATNVFHQSRSLLNTNFQSKRKLLLDDNQSTRAGVKPPGTAQFNSNSTYAQQLTHATPIDDMHQNTPGAVAQLQELLLSVTMAPTTVVVEQVPQPRPLRVLVLLDSNHAAKHVYAEMETYCTLASQGSYCIVQDTKMSRWSTTDQGPLMAVQAWLQRHVEFRQDRGRELFYTNHPQGYLLKVS